MDSTSMKDIFAAELRQFYVYVPSAIFHRNLTLFLTH